MYLQKRGNKFNNRSTMYEGRVYHSAKEADFAKTLNLLKHAVDASKRVVSWKPQPRFELRVYGSLIGHYTPDFDVQYADGHREIVEVKGFETIDWKLRWKIFEAMMEHDHPEIDLVIIK
jgi:hypothetical protein